MSLSPLPNDAIRIYFGAVKLPFITPASLEAPTALTASPFVLVAQAEYGNPCLCRVGGVPVQRSG